MLAYPSVAGIATVVTLLALGCGSSAAEGRVEQSLAQRVAALRSEQQLRQTELAAVRTQIVQAQHALERHRCEAQRAEIGSAVAVARADCLGQRAQFFACGAGNAERRSSSGFWGCLLGLGAAVVTGGAAAPMTLAGCGIGRESASATDCGVDPVCTPDPAVLEARMLATRGLSALPSCEE